MKKIFGFALIAILLVASLTVAKPVASQEPPPISITDLGAGDYSTSSDVNENNQVVGWYFPPLSPEHAFLWTSEDGIRDLGPGMALSINGLSQVVGLTFDDDPFTPTHAFVWTEDTGMTDIHSLDSSWTTWAFDINDQGMVVGCYAIGNPCDGGFCIVPYWDGAFLWTQETGMVDLNSQTGKSLTCAYDINENGQIVGESPHGPFLLTLDGTIQYITNNTNDKAYSINDAGQVAGFTRDNGVFLWSASNGFTDLDNADENLVFVNELGQVTGSMPITEGDTWYSYGYLWSQDMGRLTLPRLDCFGNSYGARSNTSGLIAGSSCGQAVLWTVEIPPPTPQKQIALIDTKVDALVNSGVLDQGEGTALVSKLDAATAQVNKGNNRAARNILGAFINTVEAFVNSERLTSVHAQPLIAAANAAINNLP